MSGMGGYLQELVRRYPQLSPCLGDVAQAYGLLEELFARGGKLLICGNGGSAADSDHIVAELMKGFQLPRGVPRQVRQRLVQAFPDEGGRLADRLQGALPAISLVSHGALLSAFGNDVAPEMAFAQQVYGYGAKADALLGISTSGNSRNVINALKVAKALGLRTIGLTGRSGGRMAELCDVTVRVPADLTSHVQELHLPIYHAWCAELEAKFFGVSDRLEPTPAAATL